MLTEFIVAFSIAIVLFAIVRGLRTRRYRRFSRRYNRETSLSRDWRTTMLPRHENSTRRYWYEHR